MEREFYQYESRDIKEWMLDVVSEEEGVRRRASKVLTDRFYAPTELLIEGNVRYEDWIRSFQEVVREVVREPRFPAAEYVQKLFTLSMALEAQRMEKLEREFREDDEWHASEEAKLGTNPSPEQVRRYLWRSTIRLCREWKEREKQPEEAFETGFAVLRIIEALGVELLPAAALIRHMLLETQQKYIASEAICRMGGSGMEFYSDLLRGIQQEDPNATCSKPLGLLLRAYPEKIPEVLSLITSENVYARMNAARALGYCGRETLREYPEVEARLLGKLRDGTEEEWHALAHAVGELGVTSLAVTMLFEATYSPDVYRVATAITSLGQMSQEPDRVVPRLIELLGGFLEPDPDWCYEGEHVRLAEALSGYGPHAAAAVPLLLERIWKQPEQLYLENGVKVEERNPNYPVLRLLGQIGPAAAEALPMLKAMREELLQRSRAKEPASNEVDDAGSNGESDVCPEALLEAIRRIEG